MTRETYTIDAAGKVFGRLASEIAILLRGKNKPDYLPYKDMGAFVAVKNINKIKFTGKKFEKKKYFFHSGYLGSKREVLLKDLFEKNPALVLKRAVLGMMPKNKLRAKQIKRLTVE